MRSPDVYKRQLLDRSVRRYGERDAFILKINHKEPAEYRRIIYKEFREEVDRLGTALTELGLKGARIGVIGENSCLLYTSSGSARMRKSIR